MHVFLVVILLIKIKIMSGSGLYADLSIFSFPVKHIAAGKMITTNEFFIKKLKILELMVFNRTKI